MLFTASEWRSPQRILLLGTFVCFESVLWESFFESSCFQKHCNYAQNTLCQTRQQLACEVIPECCGILVMN